ncbi:hypothetical protein CRUP_012340 [Coryphaenoides rupestris]|nr:hypothetical protein CRUP_012340 [Coryphaenoides rupestris]
MLGNVVPGRARGGKGSRLLRGSSAPRSRAPCRPWPSVGCRKLCLVTLCFPRPPPSMEKASGAREASSSREEGAGAGGGGGEASVGGGLLGGSSSTTTAAAVVVTGGEGESGREVLSVPLGGGEWILAGEPVGEASGGLREAGGCWGRLRQRVQAVLDVGWYRPPEAGSSRPQRRVGVACRWDWFSEAWVVRMLSLAMVAWMELMGMSAPRTRSCWDSCGAGDAVALQQHLRLLQDRLVAVLQTFSCSMFFLCCLIFFTSRGRSGMPFPASSSCSAAYSRQKAPRVFEEQLKKYEQVKVYIEQNLAAQDNILKALTEANVQYATVRKGLAHTEQQWTATVQTLVASYEAYEDLMKKSQEGKEFYDDLEAKASRGLPDSKGSLLGFIQEVQGHFQHQRPLQTPIIVHCRASRRLSRGPPSSRRLLMWRFMARCSSVLVKLAFSCASAYLSRSRRISASAWAWAAGARRPASSSSRTPRMSRREASTSVNTPDKTARMWRERRLLTVSGRTLSAAHFSMRTGGRWLYSSRLSTDSSSKPRESMNCLRVYCDSVTPSAHLYREEASWAAMGTSLANRSGPVTLGSVGLTGPAKDLTSSDTLLSMAPSMECSAPAENQRPRLTCLTAGLNWKSPASFRSSQIISIRGTASIAASFF